MSDIIIKDESGDRKYFTQLPHYILNHSTANDQALYWQMKRYAGEDGKCFATQETLIKKLGIGIKAYNKSLKYLLDKGWIKFIGMTKGKTRPIKTYSIVDIWKLNILNYEKIPSESTVSFNEEILAKSNIDTSQKNNKIPPESTVEEESLLRRTNKNTNTTLTSKKEIQNPINLLINYFFELKGWANKEKDFYGKNKIIYGRYTKPSKDLLGLCDNNLEEAKLCIKKIADWAISRDLDWSIETVFKKWYDLDILRPKEKKPYYRGNRVFEMSGRKYVLTPNGEKLEFNGKLSEIINK